MDEPLVCCILPYHTPDYVQQAIECFRSQTYENKHLVWSNTYGDLRSIGVLRNNLIAQTPRNCLIAHWDTDDWSAPNRLESQVKLLKTQVNGMAPKVAGYHDLPFYDVANDMVVMYDSGMTGYAVGTSLMYRREVWERTPFPDQMCGEDQAWQHAVRREQGIGVVSTTSVVDGKPMMIARHHAGCITETHPSSKEQPRSVLLRNGSNFKPAAQDLDRTVRSCLFRSLVAQFI